MCMVTLDGCSLFSRLQPHELKALQEAAQEKRFANGQEVFKEGDTGDGVYVVKEGQVQISSLVGNNVRHVFSEVKPGEFFGEMAVLENKPRSASAVAVGETEVYFIGSAGRNAEIGRIFAPPFAGVAAGNQQPAPGVQSSIYPGGVVQTERLAIVGRFARSIVHDLKNPLNIISITAEMAGIEKGTPELRRLAKLRITKQVDRISEPRSTKSWNSRAGFARARLCMRPRITRLLCINWWTKSGRR